ncbi:hypothetical protein LINPERPRIM_LOCUS36692, partial [Linum perenne]
NKIKSGRQKKRANMKTSRKKMKRKDTVDRISELPDEIIHQILKGLEARSGSRRLDLQSYKLAARTSILSRRWLQLWRSYPVVEINDDDHKRKDLQSFAVSTSKRLLHDRQVPLLLDSFSIRLFCMDNHQAIHQLLSSASILSPTDASSRSPLKLVLKRFCVFDPIHIDLFERDTFLNFGRTKFLHLEGFDLTRFLSFNTHLCNLQELDLSYVRVSEQGFLSFLSNARRLEKLSLKSIRGISSLDINASDFPSLISLTFAETYTGQQQLQISSAPLLQSFSFHRYCKSLTVVSSSSAPNLKKLELRLEGDIRRGEIEDLISKFPALESLDLDVASIRSSTSTDVLKISSHKLLKLTLTQLIWKIDKFEIDAPNLETLYIKTDSPPTNVNVVNVSSTCKCVAHCRPCSVLSTSWFIDLRQCLQTLDTQFQQPLVFKLDFSSPRMEVLNLDFSQLGRESSPLTVQHLQLGTDLSLKAASIEKQAKQICILDTVLSTCDPKILSIARLPHSRHNKSLFSYISGQIEGKNLQNCCTNGGCWRHRFKNAKITSVTVDDISTINNSMSSQPSINMIIVFSLDWNVI